MKNTKNNKNTTITTMGKILYEDYCKCDDIALKMASLFPESENAFTGTVSERLNTLFNHMLSIIKSNI